MEYDKHEMWRMDYAATMRNATRKGMARGMEKGMAEGMEKGMAEGMEKGMAEGRVEGRVEGLLEARMETARKMKVKGFASTDIADITGLTKKEIDRL
jgi:predicted transposase/invertase (TIGR01784 family)